MSDKLHIAPAIEQLAKQFQRLPGVGEKSALRMAWFLLQHDRQGACDLAHSLLHAHEVLMHCEHCNTLCEQTVCHLCQDPLRYRYQLCVVESPSDVAVIEKTGLYKGRYFVLAGAIKHLEGIGPKEIGLEKLLLQLSALVSEQKAKALPDAVELIIATSFNAAGEVTAHALIQAVKPLGIRVSRLSKGVPAGSEIEYVDLASLSHAFHERKLLSS